jgi:hypothetical protein
MNGRELFITLYLQESRMNIADDWRGTARKLTHFSLLRKRDTATSPGSKVGAARRKDKFKLFLLFLFLSHADTRSPSGIYKR